MNDIEAMKYLISTNKKGADICQHLKALVADRLGIPLQDIRSVQVFVSNDFSGILDHDASDSHIELVTGELIPLSEDAVMTAARHTCAGIPRDFEIVGLGFPEQSGICEEQFSYSLAELTTNCVLARNPVNVPEEDLGALLHAILQCQTCSITYFWNSGCIGEAVLSRMLNSTLGRKILCELIATYVCKPSKRNRCLSNVMTVPEGRSALIDVGWCLARRMSDALSGGGEYVVSALLSRREELTLALSERLAELLA